MHLRRIWDLGTRGSNKANSNLPWLFLFGRYFGSYFQKRGENELYKNSHSRSAFSSARAFCKWSWICRSPSGLLVNWFFACVHWGPIQLYYYQFWPDFTSSRIWDLGTRGFDEANPILLWLFFSGQYLENYLKKISKMNFTKIVKTHGFFSSIAFQWWSRNCHSPFNFSGNWFLVSVHWGPIQLWDRPKKLSPAY